MTELIAMMALLIAFVMIINEIENKRDD